MAGSGPAARAPRAPAPLAHRPAPGAGRAARLGGHRGPAPRDRREVPPDVVVARECDHDRVVVRVGDAVGRVRERRAGVSALGFRENGRVRRVVVDVALEVGSRDDDHLVREVDARDGSREEALGVLGVTVERPTVETTFRYDGETYEMPDGEALAFAPVAFANTHLDESRPVDGPLFTLVDGDRTALETIGIDHPRADSTVTRRGMGVPTTGRWNTHGAALSPGERVTGTALFRVPADTDPASVSVVYEAERMRDDRFGNVVVEWTV